VFSTSLVESFDAQHYTIQSHRRLESTPSPTLSQVPSNSPSKTQSNSPSKAPSRSSEPSSVLSFIPSHVPTVVPSSAPTDSPSDVPSYSLQELPFLLKFTFDDLNSFEGNEAAVSVFQKTTSDHVKKQLESFFDELFDVKSFIAAMAKVSKLPDQRRQLLKGGGNQRNSMRNLQESNALEVLVRLFVGVRAEKKYEKEEMKVAISKAFDTNDEQYNFIGTLQDSDNPTFSKIKEMAIQIDNKNIVVITDEKGTPTWVYIAGGSAAGVVVIIFVVTIILRRRGDDNSYEAHEFDER